MINVNIERATLTYENENGELFTVPLDFSPDFKIQDVEGPEATGKKLSEIQKLMDRYQEARFMLNDVYERLLTTLTEIGKESGVQINVNR